MTVAHVLITGAGGYIGATLADCLLQAGYRVTGVDRYFFGESLLGETLSHPRFRSLKKDIRELEVADFATVDAVCDLAALSNDPCGELNERLTYAINHLGRVHVAAQAKRAGVRQYILASSCSVYGQGASAELTETSLLHPLSAYARANVLAEQDVMALGDARFSVTALRLSTVFGLAKRMRFDLAINIMTLNAFRKGRITVMGGGRQWRPFVHVRDAAQAFAQVIGQAPSHVGGQVFNVGSAAHNYEILRLAEIVRENLPAPVAIDLLADDIDNRSYHVSFQKIAEMLGFAPRLSPADGVREIHDALIREAVDTGPRTITLKWYQNLLANAAESLLESSREMPPL